MDGMAILEGVQGIIVVADYPVIAESDCAGPISQLSGQAPHIQN
jgi:hypothetical protein